jgi:hypothetical protein
MYPNMAEFKLALLWHTIKNEFEYNTERSGPKWLRAYCSRKEEEIVHGGYMLLQWLNE